MFIIKSVNDVENYVYKSYMRALPNINLDMADKHYRRPELTRRLINLLNKPDEKQYNILVTGSKGKGSVSRMLSKLLENHGYKVGLFTGPHLINFKERIRINGIAISDQDLVKYANLVKMNSDKIQEDLAPNRYIGPVGISAAISLLYFLENKTDFNIIECGKGARFDDVNVIHSRAAIINSVFEEHIPQLGNNLREIAFNKSGIIKAGQDFVAIADQNSQVLEVIDSEARKMDIKLIEYHKDYCCHSIKISASGTSFGVKTKDGKYDDLTLRLLGRHQAKNAALAIATAERIIDDLDYDAVKRSLEELTWPGRLEIINENPTILIDGCINKECADYVIEVLEDMKKDKVFFIVGIPDDKDYMGVLSAIKGVASKTIITRTLNQCLKFTEEQLSNAKSIFGNKVIYASSIYDSLELVKEFSNEDDLICILGTQSLIKETKEFFNQDTLNLI